MVQENNTDTKKIIDRFTSENAEEIILKYFPYIINDIKINKITETWLNKNFGKDSQGVVIGTIDFFEDEVEFQITEDQRWDYWEHIYFKNEEDAILFKLKFG